MQPEELTIRRAEAGDAEDLFRWRNHPVVRKNSFQTGPLSWEEHQQWFDRKIKSADTAIFIGMVGNRKAGAIRFDGRQADVCVSVMMGSEFIGRGLGSRLIAIGTRSFIEDRGAERPIIAEIKEDNVASIKAFEKAGYVKNRMVNQFEYREKSSWAEK